MNGKEFCVELSGETRRASEEILCSGIRANADCDALANGPVLLNVFFVKIGRQSAVNLFGHLAQRQFAGGN